MDPMQFTCSRCDRPNQSAETGPFGTCATCGVDGTALCDVCYGQHEGHNPRYRGHVFARASVSNPSTDAILGRLGLPVPTLVCKRHGDLPFTGLTCNECALGAEGSAVSLCLECIKEHSVFRPGHRLINATSNSPALRNRLVAAVWEPIPGCHPLSPRSTSSRPVPPTTSPTQERPDSLSNGSLSQSVNQRSASRGRSYSPRRTPESSHSGSPAASTPLVACARHKVVAVARELDTLLRYAAVARCQLDAAQGAAASALVSRFGVLSETLEAEVSARRTALDTELAAADAALNVALASTANALEAADTLSDAALSAHTPAILERIKAARATVVAIPVLPKTSAFVAVTPPSAAALRAAVAGAMGVMSLSLPQPHPHVHTPHCGHITAAPMVAGDSYRDGALTAVGISAVHS